MKRGQLILGAAAMGVAAISGIGLASPASPAPGPACALDWGGPVPVRWGSSIVACRVAPLVNYCPKGCLAARREMLRDQHVHQLLNPGAP